MSSECDVAVVLESTTQALSQTAAALQQAIAELNSSRKEAEGLQREVARASAESAEQARALEAQAQELARRDLDIQAKTGALAGKDAELQRASAELGEARRVAEGLRSDLAEVSARLRASQARATELAKQVKAQSEALRQRDAELRQRDAELRAVLQERAQKEAELREALGEADRFRRVLRHFTGNATVAWDRDVELNSLVQENAQREADLQEARAELDRLRKLVIHLDDSATGLPAGVLDAGRYRGASPLDFYDAVLSISGLEDIYLPHKGWQVQVTQRREFDFGAPLEGVRVVAVGELNSGKTWLLAQLSGADLPKGTSVHTEGISIKEATVDNLKIALLDTAGWNLPMDAVPCGARNVGSESAELVLQELRAQEDFYRHLCFELGQVVLLVIGQISHKDQVFLVHLARAIRKDRVRKDIVVVHNLHEWDMAMLLERSPTDRMSYVERNKALFGLSDSTLDVTMGAETRRVVRHEGLLTEGQGNSLNTVVSVYHYYLTNHSLPCSCNKFAIQDMKKMFFWSVGVKKSLAEELAWAATKLQSRFASFKVDEPRIVFDPTESCFRTKEPVPGGAYRMNPRHLGSFLAMCSGDPDYNIMLLPGIVKKTTGRGTGKMVEEEEREAYQVQIELPGLTADSLRDIQEQFEHTDHSGALLRESLQGECGNQWTISFEATLMNVPDGVYNEVAAMTDREVDLWKDVSLHEVPDSGSRNHFRYGTGTRTVKVVLCTRIKDYDTCEYPIVTYVDGVLGITLFKQVSE